jgi:hypothetical protein
MNHYQILLLFYLFFSFYPLYLYLFYLYAYHDIKKFHLHNFQKMLNHIYYHHLFFYDMNWMLLPLMQLLRFCFSKKKIFFSLLLI